MTKVLVAEDDRDMQFLYHTALSQHDIEVVQAEDARMVMIELGKQQFDVVILDLNLPDAHGSVVIDQIAQNNLHPLNRIVVVTANDHWVDNILDLGVEHLLVKPISMSSVVALIRELVEA